MRVTENSLINLAQDAAQKGQERLAIVGQVASSGIAVDRPSEDAVKWAEGTRADARKIMSTARAGTIARGDERMTTADQTLQTMTSVLQRTQELATQMANATYSAENRQYSAIEVSQLRDSALAAVNVQDNNGEYVFSGTDGDKPPFDANGTYTGNAATDSAQIAEHQQQILTIPGTVFTAATGVDIFKTLSDLATAMQNNDVAGISNSLPLLQQAVNQIASARSIVGTRSEALKTADTARQDFENTLEETKSRTTYADPIAAASDLTKAKTALDTASALSQQILSVIRTFQSTG